MASCSSGFEGDVQEFGWRFPMFQAFSDDAQRKRLHASHGFVAVRSVAHDASQTGNLGDPPAVGFALKLDRKGHRSTVASGLTDSQRRSVNAPQSACNHRPGPESEPGGGSVL